MKKTILLAGLLLVLFVLVLFAPPQDKAEKLRHEDNDWDRDGQQFIVQMSYKFGIATAGEHADFKARTTLTIDTGENVYTATGERVIQKVEGVDKDPDGYIEIEPTYIKWDSGDFEGSTTVTSSISLVGPSGNVQGDVIVTPPTIIEVMWPDSPVKHDDNNWEYDPLEGDIIVPLLAHPDKVDFLQNEGYQVTVEVDVSGDYLTGSGKGSAAIVKHDDQGWDYVQIQPVLADASVEWNGDDDGSGIVSSTIGLVRPDGSVYSTTTFGPQTVWFVTHKPPPEH
jgi:hypothetical protein